jgi:uncharacterized protein (DUF2147 family)
MHLSVSRWLAILLVSLSLVPMKVRAADNIAGFWFGRDYNGHMEIRPCGTMMCGYIVSILDPTIPPNPHDIYNEKPELRSRPLCGLQILGDLKFNDGVWEGWVYDPHRGKTFSVEVKLQDANTLNIHGYLGVKLLGETQVWTRASKDIAKCTRSVR